MKIMNCPLNGPRNINEFIYGGEVEPLVNPADYADRDWAGHLFLEENRAGVVQEWWCHSASAYWFIAERNTVTDEILKTYPATEVFKERFDYPVQGESS